MSCPRAGWASTARPARPAVRYVDDPDPSFHGFDGFRKGLRPSDFELGKKVPGVPLPRPAAK